MSDRSIYGRHESYSAGGPKISREEYDTYLGGLIEKYIAKRKAKKKVPKVRIEMERPIPKKKKESLWELNKYHTPEDYDLAEKFPAHIGGGTTSILPALPKTREKWQAKWPDDFDHSLYTFGYNSEYPIPSDKVINREIQLRKLASELAKKLESMPKDKVMRHIQDNWQGSGSFGADALKRATGSPEGYSIGPHAFPRGFRTLPLPRDKRHEQYFREKEDEYWGAGSKGKRRGLIRRK